MDRTATRSVTCEECIDVLVDYVDGTMDAVTTEAFEAHFADCQPCVDFLKTYQATIRVSGRVLDEPIPEAVRERLHTFLRANCQGKKPGCG